MANSKPTPSRSRPPRPSPQEQKLADDLHTHQIELQMQNQELVRAKVELERSRARYFELFDFAPVPYFTFTERGTIDSLNLAAAEFLRVDRDRAVGSAAAPYFENESRNAFRAHLRDVLDHPGKHAVDLVLAAPG